MSTLLLFGGGVYIVAGSLSTLTFVSGFILAKRWLRSHHDEQGGKLRVTIESGYKGRKDLDVLNEAADAAESRGFKRPRIYREDNSRTSPKRRKK